MPIRTKNTYGKHIYDFIKDIDIVCPGCAKKARVTSEASLSLFSNIDHNRVKVVCGHCGYNKMHKEIPKGKGSIQWTFIIGGAIDPYFHQPLWLVKKIGENVLWAYNDDHLHFLEEHVSATLRERNIEKMENSSLGSRLPKWLTSKKNREVMVKAIQQLKVK